MLASGKNRSNLCKVFVPEGSSMLDQSECNHVHNLLLPQCDPEWSCMSYSFIVNGWPLINVCLQIATSTYSYSMVATVVYAKMYCELTLNVYVISCDDVYLYVFKVYARMY